MAAMVNETNNRFFRMRTQRPGLAFSLMFLIFSACAGRNETPKAVTPPPTVQIIFFTPSDLAMPAGAWERLTKIADATEKFFFNGMNHWGYPPAAKSLFQREPDGMVKVLNVRGDMPVSSGKYARPNYATNVIEQATRQYHMAGEGHVWWIFIYLGDPPARFENFVGSGNPQDGGHAMVNFDSRPGEIRPDLGLAEGFNGEYFLKGTIHELGHAFGLHHTGPDLSLGLGNSLMGPTTAVYAKRKYPKPDQVYLTESSAAMLWKHPIFAGTAMRDVQLPSVKLVDYKPAFNQADDTVTISGKLISDQPAHSVVLLDDLGRPKDQYWVLSHTARIGPDGAFQIKINKPAKVDGHYRILFCFENGLVTGDGADVVFNNRGDIRKSYSFRNGDFQFGD
jgi:predicted Zn-dependent protease